MMSQDPNVQLRALNPLAVAFQPKEKEYQFKIETKAPDNEDRVVGTLTRSQAENITAAIASTQDVIGKISIPPSDLRLPFTNYHMNESDKLFGNDIARLSTKLPQKSDASAAESSLYQMALTEFHLFPCMPSEIKLRVWKLKIPGPRIVEIRYNEKSRAEVLKHYTLLFDAHWLTPRVFINPQIDTLYFSEKRGGEFDKVFEVKDNPYINYFKTMTNNVHSKVFQNLRRVAINDGAYLGNIEWDHEREDVLNLAKFTNLDIAAAVLDAGNKIIGPIKLVQVTWGACPVHTEYGRARPDYDGDEVLHSCNLCGCPFIKELLEELAVDHIYFEQLERGLRTMFSNFEKEKLPGWKVPKTKTMALAETKKDVTLGQFEFHFRDVQKLVVRPAGRAGVGSSVNHRFSF